MQFIIITEEINEFVKKKIFLLLVHHSCTQSIDYEWGFIWVFLRPLVEEIEENMRALGISTVLIPIRRSDTTQEIVGKIRRAGVRAVVALHYGNAELFTVLEQSEIPVVVVMNGNFQDSFYSVCVDDYQGAYEGTLHLTKDAEGSKFVFELPAASKG